MKIQYRPINFREQSLELIERVNSIIEEYQAKGYSLTLRQVYYQLVARDIIPNNERSYKNLGNLISDGRMAGLIDWNSIIDRTRNLQQNSHWETPAEIIEASAKQFSMDKWDGQDYYVEVWVEKDALIGIVGKICRALDVPYFSCRGYVSQSEMWSAAQRIIRKAGCTRFTMTQRLPVIIHLGDHDPSGIDMSRDIQDRLYTFGIKLESFDRIALNYDQVETYNPPPNPTKLTDSRCHGYIEQHGHECWELDALRPEVIEDLIEDAVRGYCNMDLFQSVEQKIERHKETLQAVADHWEHIAEEYGGDVDE